MEAADNYGVFSGLPEKLKQKYSIEYFMLRPFGFTAEDISINFSQTHKSQLTTSIMHNCIYAGDTRLPEQFFWDLAIGHRIEALLSIALSAFGFRIELNFVCAHNECGKQMEIELTKEDITQIQKPAYSKNLNITIGGRMYGLRRPTEVDRLRWKNTHELPYESIIFDLLIPQEVTDPNDGQSALPVLKQDKNLVSNIEKLLEEADPLTNFVLHTSCPHCNSSNSFEVDLEELSLRLLYGMQKKQLSLIHRLACAYHWNEQDILKLPYWRRLYYMQLIQREAL